MRIVVLEPIGIKKEESCFYQEQLKKLGHELVQFQDKPASELELIGRAKEADILVVSNMPLQKNVLEKCSNLKLISVAFTGIDHISTDYCKEKGIRICNAAGYSNESVAELTFGMIFSLQRNISRNDMNTRLGSDRKGKLGTEISGKVFGIIGMGTIGSKVACIAQAFGCKVLAYSRTRKEIGGVQFVCKEELLKQSDIVSLHVPLTKETRGLLGKEDFAIMKKESILINTARGQVLDSSALAMSLTNNEISGAAIDVYEYEPPLKEDHPLLDAPNTLLLPHIAYATHEAIAKRTKIVFDNIMCWLNNEPINIQV